MSQPSEEEPRHTQLQDESPTVAPPEPSPSLVGATLLDRYRVIDKLGAGGMGTVYLAEHVTIGKKFAIKVLSNEYAHREDLVYRFLQEARAASMISQQNVVEITDFGDTPDGSVFFVMEFLDGEDLRAMLEREGKLPWPRVRHLMLQVCRALEAAHAAGIIHRDMKPDNCFRIRRGRDEDFIKVLDFGIAKIQGEGGKGLTQTGMIFGTPEYMSPEQAQGEKTDHRVDIYAVGVIMYQLLCGRVPFRGDTFMAILTKHMFEVPGAPSDLAPDAEIPPEAEAIVLKAMQKERSYRFETMAEMIAAIEAVGTGAAAVDVITEDIVQPEAGPTNFMRRDTGTLAAVSAPEPASGRRAGVLVGLGGLLTAAAVLGYVVLGNQLDSRGKAGPEPAPEPEPVVAKPDPEPAPQPEVATPEPAPAPAVVHLHFDTNVPVQVLDARDRAIYGSSDAEGGIEFPISQEPLALILRAEGYEELEIEAIPDRERKRYAYDLVELGHLGGASKQRRRQRNQGEAAVKDDAEPDDDQPKPSGGSTLPSKGSHDGDLKNPFAK